MALCNFFAVLHIETYSQAIWTMAFFIIIPPANFVCGRLYCFHVDRPSVCPSVRDTLVFYIPGIYAEGYIVFVFPFIRSYVRSYFRPFRGITLKVLHASNSSGVYLTNHSSESIHIWTTGTLEGQLSFHDSLPQGPCPGMGLEVKI